MQPARLHPRRRPRAGPAAICSTSRRWRRPCATSWPKGRAGRCPARQHVRQPEPDRRRRRGRGSAGRTAQRRSPRRYLVGCDGAWSPVREAHRRDAVRLSVRRALAGHRREGARQGHRAHGQSADLRSRAAHHLRPHGSGAAPLGVHAAARRDGASRCWTTPSSSGCWRPGTAARYRDRAQGGLPLPRPGGRALAQGARAPRRRRRAPDAALRRPGHVLGPARRRQPGLEARAPC